MAPKSQIATNAKKTPVTAKELLERAQLFWKELKPQQQIYLGLGAAITLAVAIFLIRMIASPNYKPLMSGLEPADAQIITTQLTTKKIPYKLSPDGATISVPADQLSAARMDVASHDPTHSGRIGFEIFDKVSWGQTEFDEKVNYQRALEGELERTIQTIGNVKSVRVHLVQATDSVFTDHQRDAKASVTLKLKRGSLTREEIAAISRLVAGAVDNLKPSDVAIIDADSNQTLGLGNSTAEGGDEMERELNRRIIATLSPVVGADRIHSSVNVEYENASSETSEEKYDPAVSALLTMQHSEEVTGAVGKAAGVPGTSSNVPKSKAKPQGDTDKQIMQSSKSDNNTYGVNKTMRRMIAPAGGIRRLTAAVVLDDAVEHRLMNGKWVDVRHKRDPEQLKLISELAQGAIGFNADRGDTISVQNLSFDRPATTDAEPTGFAEQARKSLQDNAVAVRYASILLLFALIYFFTIRPIQKRALAGPPQPELPEQPELPGMAATGEPAGLGGDAELPPPAPDPALLLVQRSQELRKEVIEFVKNEPETSTTAIRAWLREDEA